MKIAIIGLGLIGGSLGLALKKNGAHSLIGIPRDEKTLQKALALGVVDEGTTDHLRGVKEADLVFVCVPINLIVPVVGEIAPHLKKGAIVTDVASTKYEVVTRLEKAMPKGTYFIGGHPLAGKEQFKIDAAEAGLFNDRTWVLTRTSRTSQRAMEKVTEIVRLIGAKPIELEPKTHDLVVAAISHVPLAVAVALVNAVSGEAEKVIMAQCAASGFRDSTRVASGDPILGVDIFTTNKKAVLKMIGSFKRSLSNLEKVIKDGNAERIKAELEKAKSLRDSIYG